MSAEVVAHGWRSLHGQWQAWRASGRKRLVQRIGKRRQALFERASAGSGSRRSQRRSARGRSRRSRGARLADAPSARQPRRAERAADAAGLADRARAPAARRPAAAPTARCARRRRPADTASMRAPARQQRLAGRRQTRSHAFEHGMRQVRARRAHASGRRSTPLRVGIVVRRALAAKVGQEERRARRARRHSAPPPRRAARASLAAPVSARDPAQAARRRQHHAIWCQVPGSAWQNACTACAGVGAEAGRGDEEHARGAERDEAVARRCTAPMPTALAALSPAPPATTMPGGKPQSRASSAAAWPLTSLPSTRRGMCARVRPRGGEQRIGPARARRRRATACRRRRTCRTPSRR